MLIMLKLLLDGEDIVELMQEFPRMTPCILTLQRKGLVTVVRSTYEITLEGRQALEQLLPKIPKTTGNKEIIVAADIVQAPKKPAPAALDVTQMHVNLQNKLHSYIKKKQVTGFGNVLFIPSVKDLEEFLLRFRRKYGELWDAEKVEKVLLRHVEDCAKRQKFSPAVKYFIIKEGTGSQLAAALENFNETPIEDEQHNLTNTKDLFE